MRPAMESAMGSSEIVETLPFCQFGFQFNIVAVGRELLMIVVAEVVAVTS